MLAQVEGFAAFVRLVCMRRTSNARQNKLDNRRIKWNNRFVYAVSNYNLKIIYYFSSISIICKYN